MKDYATMKVKRDKNSSHAYVTIKCRSTKVLKELLERANNEEDLYTVTKAQDIKDKKWKYQIDIIVKDAFNNEK